MLPEFVKSNMIISTTAVLYRVCNISVYFVQVTLFADVIWRSSEVHVY